MEYETTIYLKETDEEIDVTVEFSIIGSYHAATRIDPAEYPEVEIESITDSEGNDRYDDADIDSLSETLMEYARECAADAKHEAEIDRYEAHMEAKLDRY